VTNRGHIQTAGRIIEVEAYRASDDPASHAYRNLTTRNRSMNLSGGHLYVYLSSGIHTCLNIVTGRAGTPKAVLIRALTPTVGLEVMYRRRATMKQSY
jgi:DNA-3-methyladenine glycosylase